jgi:uncharacterized membrane protein (UPF0182 family)
VHRRRRSDCHRYRIDLIVFNGDFAKLNARTLDTGLWTVIMSGARNSALPNLTTRIETMTINKLLIAMALGLALTACSKPEQAQDAAASANEAAADAQTAADQASASGSQSADAAQAAANTAAASADTAADAAQAASGAATDAAADQAADAAKTAEDTAEAAKDTAEEAKK